MSDEIYIWRCAKCSSHFANITKIEGFIKQEKKCSKCKSLNSLSISKKEIFVHCKFFDPGPNTYGELAEGNDSYPIISE